MNKHMFTAVSAAAMTLAAVSAQAQESTADQPLAASEAGAATTTTDATVDPLATPVTTDPAVMAAPVEDDDDDGFDDWGLLGLLGLAGLLGRKRREEVHVRHDDRARADRP